ncbi:MAG: dTDP-4-dehydrorhamnose 3,5-epimerase [Acidiferrobacterales bacterium]|nr:dTDP-4-dehydrorhamnose 3,5-epimerase [Acidiferrobacterales bacterium]
MEVEKTKLPGVVLLTPKIHGDERGFFMETFNQATFGNLGLPDSFVQDNHSRSSYGVLRGLHFQYPQWQGKLVRVLNGEIFDVAVDVRADSPSFGQWVGVTLSAENKQQLYIPSGYAHGFCVTSDIADVAYKCTSLYKPEDDVGIRWDDPDVNVEWPISDPIVSTKDQAAARLRDIRIT